MPRKSESMTVKLDKQLFKYQEAHKIANTSINSAPVFIDAERAKFMHLAIGYLQAFRKLKAISNSRYYRTLAKVLDWENGRYEPLDTKPS